MYLTKFVHTQNGKYIMSALLGFGLATIFRAVCKDKNCLIFHAPPLDEIKDKIFQQDGKCYVYDSQTVKCDPKKRHVVF
jgi:hypothetical protein